MTAGPYVLGIDASLTRTAAVLVPVDWGCSFQAIRFVTSGSSLKRTATQLEVATRLADIARDVVQLVGDEQLEGAFIENYSFGSPFGAHQLGELRGVLRDRVMRRTSLAPEPVAINSHRKYLFGTLPKLRGDALKHHIVTTLRGWGAPHAWGDDVCDAFSVANYGLSELGYPALTLASAAQAVGA